MFEVETIAAGGGSILATDGVRLRVGPESAVEFRLVTRREPRRVLLDPSGECLRRRPLKGIGIVEAVDFGGEQ